MKAYVKPDYIEVPVKVHELEWQKRGLDYTKTGYGLKIPSRYMIKDGNRWKRVYIACFSNVASAYILRKGERVFVEIDF